MRDVHQFYTKIIDFRTEMQKKFDLCPVASIFGHKRPKIEQWSNRESRIAESYNFIKIKNWISHL